MLTVERLMEILHGVDPDAKIFFSRGDHSDEAIDARPYTMCEQDDGKWVKCLSESCTRNWARGVLIL